MECVYEGLGTEWGVLERFGEAFPQDWKLKRRLRLPVFLLVKRQVVKADRRTGIHEGLQAHQA